MAQGISLHLGLNQIDPAVYGTGNDLAGCVNDARAMQALAVAQGFQTTLMLDEQATSASVIQAIAGAASSLRAGDMLLLTYSGHGSQVPDKNGDEPDGSDETWCLYDRMLIDDELNQLWSQFSAGVRIFMLSDSCHSGTVARMLKARDLVQSAAVSDHYRGLRKKGPLVIDGNLLPPGPPPSTRLLRQVKPRAVEPPYETPVRVNFRWLPQEAAEHAYRESKGLYDTLQLLTGSKNRATIAASVILISGCQDNQLSADGDVNGLFTETLLKVWKSGAFSGDHRQFHQRIASQMPMTQTPNYFKSGVDDPVFEKQKPFTVTVDATNEPVAASLWVRGPETIARDGAPPSFRVNPGPNSYYIFEITNEAALLDTGVNRSRRNGSNFYGSWSDSAHLSGIDYTLPKAVWDQLKSASTLYYRIGSVATSTGWTNYMVSTPDQQYANAPTIAIQGVAGGTTSSEARPTITGPSSLASTDDPPTFSVDTLGAPYFIVEVATDARLFDGEAHDDADPFYGSWSDTALLTGDTYTLPEAVWTRLATGDALYYRVGTTTSATDWADYTVSSDDGASDGVPSIAISDARVPQKKAG
jgi:metacaspase-1